MTEPSTTAAAAMAATGVTTVALFPVLSAMGLRADVLCAGFAGALAMLTLLPQVPVDDIFAELATKFPHLSLFLRIWWISSRRIGVVVGSTLVAGYCNAGASWFGLPEGLSLFSAFILGAGAQKILPLAIQYVRPAAARS